MRVLIDSTATFCFDNRDMNIGVIKGWILPASETWREPRDRQFVISFCIVIS